MTAAQATLVVVLAKLGVEHPYHTLYHLLALSNGTRGSDGRRVRDPLAATGGMSHAVDPGKVAAADSTLRRIANAPNRCGGGNVDANLSKRRDGTPCLKY